MSLSYKAAGKLSAGPRQAGAKAAGAALRSLEGCLGVVAVLILAVLLLAVLVTVAMRYVFSIGFIGAEELGIWLHVALIAVGAPLALQGALAMRLDVFVRMLPERLRLVTDIMADTFVVVSALVLAFGGSEIMTMLGGISPALGLPEWIRFGFLGLGGFLVLVTMALQGVASGRAVSTICACAMGAALYVLLPQLRFDVPLPPSVVLGLVACLGLIVAAPLPHVFLAAAYVAVAFGSTLPEPAIVSSTVGGMSKFLLLAIPFFLLTGNLLTASGVANQLVRFASSLVGHRRAGLAQTTLLTSVLFSGASGSSVANAAFSASTFQPALVKHGYPLPQSAAIIASTSVLDNVIPPSIAFLILAAATNLSVGSLLVGGFFAGGVMAFCLAVAIHLTVGKVAPQPKADTAERWRSAFSAVPAFGLGVIVVAGIRFGLVTTTEAAAVAALYTLGLGCATRLGATSLFNAFRQSAIEAAAIGLLIGSAAPFAFLLAVDNIAGVVSDLTFALGGSAIAVLLISNVILLVAGLVLDIGAAILLFGPIMLPAAIAAGIDPIVFGVILVVNLMIGGLTPPVGMLVFVVSGVTRLPPTAIFRAIMPYLFALLVSLFTLCLWAIIF